MSDFAAIKLRAVSGDDSDGDAAAGPADVAASAAAATAARGNVRRHVTLVQWAVAASLADAHSANGRKCSFD